MTTAVGWRSPGRQHLFGCLIGSFRVLKVHFVYRPYVDTSRSKSPLPALGQLLFAIAANVSSPPSQDIRCGAANGFDGLQAALRRHSSGNLKRALEAAIRGMKVFPDSSKLA
jgi:hypothetical protein